MRLVTIYIDTLDDDVYYASRQENITVCEAMKAILANPSRDWIVERGNESRLVDCDYFHHPSLEMYEWMAWKSE